MNKSLFRVIVLSAALCILAMGQSARADVTDGLISYWPFDEGSGTIAEDAVGGNDGDIRGGAAWVTGKFGTALSFDGAGYYDDGNPETDYVDCGSDASLKPASAVTVSAWIKTDYYVYYGQIAGCMTDTGASESGYAILTEDVGYLGAWITGDSGDGWYLWTTDVPPYPNTEWVHVALTYDGVAEESILYINADPKVFSSQAGDIDYDHVGNFLIGCYDDPIGGYWWPYAGLIDDVGVWDRALTQEEIDELYNGGDGNPVTSSHVVEPIAPTNGAQYVPVDTDLSWTLPEEFIASGYDLYFGTDPNTNPWNSNTDWTKELDKQVQNSWDPPDGPSSGDMALDTPYYWQVDVYDPNDGEEILYVGPIWNFTTIGNYPVILTHPQDQVSDAAGNAEFTVAGLVIENYAWFKSDDPNNDTPGDDTAVGTDSATLTLTGTGLSDEGYYYCEVSNTGGTPDTAFSNVARLMTMRLVGHWTYDAEDFNDSSPSGNDGTAAGDPDFTAGLVGAFALNLDGNDYLVIDTVAADLLTNNDITMSAWVKTAADGELIACNTSDGGNVIMLEVWDDVASTDPGGAGTTIVNDDSWHLLTFVRNGSDGYIYVDGVEEYAGSASFNFDPTDRWSIGQEWDGGPTPSDFLTGQTDDTRIYNYALTYDEVSQLYIDVNGGSVCQEIDEFDVTGPTPGVPDCVVNILDLLESVEGWLQCGRYPVSECGSI